MHTCRNLHHSEKEHIAYFSMEMGISHTIPTYSGGLGVLAGDLLKSYADMKIPVVGITLLNEKGYFYQKIDSEGNQKELPVEWNTNETLSLMPNEVFVGIEGRKVKVRAWKLMVRGYTGNTIPVFFLDTNLAENSDDDKKLTSFLYGGDRKYRLAQEIILGIGGLRMLESLGYTNIKKYHMNEGHAALLTIELLKKSEISGMRADHFIETIREKCVFTTHTPVAAGHDKFDVALFRKMLGDFLIPDQIMEKITQDNTVNMTLLGLTMSKYLNGVAKRHGEITREMFPEFRIDSITNGIHPQTWVSPYFKEIFDEYIPGWALDPFTLRYALSIPTEKIWDAHTNSKKELIDSINNRTNIGFHISRFTVGYARRFTGYKRPELILHDIEKLISIAEKVGDVQIIFAGKAHMQDYNGKEIIKKIFQTCSEVNKKETKLRMVFLENYDMKLARMLVAGCDIWLNTPQKPFEASGTSGMKAALNGVPQFSTLDGWWVEGHIEGITGWSIGTHPHGSDSESSGDFAKDAKSMYEKLENNIIPLFYSNPEKWKEIMRHCIAINASFFNTYRMAQQYIANAYLY